MEVRSKPRYAIRLVTPFVATVCAAMALSAATNPASAAASRVTINFDYYWSGSASTALQKIIAQYNKSQSSIFVVGVHNPSETAKLADMAASTGAFSIASDWNQYAGSYASKGLLQPLTPYIKQDHYDLSDFFPEGLRASEYHGVLYELPNELNDTALLYNKTDFANAGITSPPTTFTQMAEDIAKLTKVGPNGITQLGFGNETGMFQGTNVTPDYFTLGFAFGGGWYTAAGKATPDRSANVAAANFWVDNVVKKVGASNLEKFASGFGAYESAQDPFFEGKIAMITDGEWQPGGIKAADPKLQYGVVPIPYPAGKPGLANTTTVSAGTFFIPRNAPHKEQAWQFMKYLLSPGPMVKFDYDLSNLPARRSLLNNPIFNSLPNYSVWLKLLNSPNAHPFIASQSWPTYSQYASYIGTAGDNISLLKDTPQQAFSQVAQEMQDLTS